MRASISVTTEKQPIACSQPQSRLHAKLDVETAGKIFALLETEFEDDGFAVSAHEISQKQRIWEVSVYADTRLATPTQQRIAKVLAATSHTIAFAREDLPDIDWVAKSLRELAPVRAGRFVVHGSHDLDAPRPHETAIRMDAGLAFGTGHHGTTAGCLNMLGDVLKRRKFSNVLDLGTGSGVLAIAVAKAARSKVLASDIDPVATRTAQQNVRMNGVTAYVHCLTAAGFGHREVLAAAPFDLVLANILATPLQKLARDCARHMQSGATAILSGLLPHQKAPLVASYRLQGLVLKSADIDDGWLTLRMQKP